MLASFNTVRPNMQFSSHATQLARVQLFLRRPRTGAAPSAPLHALAFKRLSSFLPRRSIQSSAPALPQLHFDNKQKPSRLRSASGAPYQAARQPRQSISSLLIASAPVSSWHSIQPSAAALPQLRFADK